MKASLFLLPVALVTSAAQAQNLPPRIAQAMRIMPLGSETLAVAQGTHTIPASLKAKSEADLSQVGLSNLQLGVIAPNLRGRTIELSMEARSHFRPPKGLGLMPYDGCGLLYLKPQKGETRAALEMKLLKTTKKTTLIAGQRVGIFEDKREHDTWRVYVAVPQADMVMLATDRSSLETTLGRLKTVASLKDSAFPASWSGW
ncbi:hypothetical protein EON83_22520 [bacterium]|nr:MAG: hypothetical protein EON83_22520 [bacterium]